MISSRFKCWKAAIAACACLLLASPAMADELGSWHIDHISGEAFVHGKGVQQVALSPGQSIKPGTVIETGSNGRVLLSRGTETIAVSPDSSLEVAPDSDKGGMTHFLQRLGTILLKVDKKNHKHFEVETPFLAAVVKGTKFTVSVEPEGAAVHVMQGVVEVTDLDTGDVGMIRPGQTAEALAGMGKGLQVDGPGVAPVKRSERAPRKSEAGAPPVRTKNEREAPVQIRDAKHAALDIATATDGLARGVNATTGKNAKADEGNGNGWAGDNPVAAAAQAGNSSAPGLSGSAPGLSGSAPGQSGSAPGLSGSAPGLSGSAPGQSGAAPGLSGSAPGLSGSASGLSGSSPGQSGSAPGLSGSAGKSGSAPGRSG